MTPQNPYVGPRPFEENEQQFFFGRSEEVAILEGLVMARRASLFFAQSGAGKSSLLRAGLIPELTRQQTVGRGPRARVYQKMRVLPILSVGGAVPSTVQPANVFIFNALYALRPDAVPAELARLALPDALATYFEESEGERERRGDDNTAPQSANLPAHPSTLLIFDQFEELFTHHLDRWTEREGFFRQVAETLERYPDLHVLFTMREDYIAEVVPFAGLLPEALRPRFRLERLKRQAALDAITLPAARAGRSYADGVAEALVENLSRTQVGRGRTEQGDGRQGDWEPSQGDRETSDAVAAPAAIPIYPPQRRTNSSTFGEFVEPVHLQIVCRQLWENLPAGHRVIQAEDVQAFGDVDQALTDFYESAVKKMVDQTHFSERIFRDWCDTHLVTPARTKGLVYRGEADTEGLPNAAADVLNDAYIIRATMRGNDTWYELAHDRLVEPILEANRRWEAAYYNPLAGPALAWSRAGRTPRLLLRGAQLQEARAFVDAHPADVTVDERAFLAESTREAQQSTRRRRAVAAALTAVIVALSALAIAAWLQARQARSSALAATAVTALQEDPERSILLALEAIDNWDTPQAEEALHQALLASRVLFYLRGHTAEVNDVAYSPDGSLLATASVDGTARLWDARNGQELRQLVGHQGTVNSASFSPDGARVATAGADGTVRIWQTDTGHEILDLPAQQGAVNRVAWSPDGVLLATAGDDDTARLWNAETGELVNTLEGHTDDVYSVAFSPDGQRLASGSRDRTAIVWDVATGQRQVDFVGHTDAINDVAFSPDGARLATASWDDQALIWDAQTGDQLLPIVGHDGWVRGVEWSADGRTLATSSWDRTARLWDADTGKELLRLTGHLGWIQGIAFDPSCSTPPGSATPGCNLRLATASEDGTARVWSLTAGRDLWTFNRPHEGASVEGIAVDPAGETIATAGLDGVARLWDTASGQLQMELAHPCTSNTESVDQEACGLRDVAFSADGQRVATAGNDRTAIVWDAATGEKIETIEGHDGVVVGVAFSPDGSRLATASSDYTARVWDLQTGEQLLELGPHPSRVNAVAYSPDGKWLATASNNDTTGVQAKVDWDVAIWDAENGDLLRTLDAHRAEVYDVDFSPDGRRLATASVDETAKVWDAATGKELLELPGHVDRIQSIAFSDDQRGDIIATGSWDRTTRLWDGRTGDLWRTLRGAEKRVRDVTFYREGDVLVTADEEGVVRAYVLRKQDLVDLARTRLQRGWTTEECLNYLGTRTCPPKP